jgi:quercetin dioxygenase-like cupin family protein
MMTGERAVRKESSMAKKKLRPTVSHLATSKFSRRGLRNYFEYRDLGVSRATGGRAHAHVIRARPEKAPHGDWHYHDCKVQFTYVLKGWVKMQYEGEKPIVMKAGSCFFQPARIKHREIAHSGDLEMLEVAAPQRFRTYDAKVR